MKKILFTVHDFYPVCGGAGEVVYRLAKRFAKAGYETTVATQDSPFRSANEVDGIKIAPFKINGNKVKGYQGKTSEIKRYLDFVINSNFDTIVNYAAQNWCSDLVFENIPKIKAPKILVPCGYSHLKDPRYFFYFRWLPKILKEYDSLVYLTRITQDFEYHQKHQLGNFVIIPNGADEEEFLGPPTVNVKEKYRIKTPYLAICVANYFFLKGQDFVIAAFNKLTRNDITLVFIGQQKNNLYYNIIKWIARNNNRILFLENIQREETISFFKAADFFLFGSRLECSPLVMFESFAAQTLFITRDVGNVLDFKQYLEIVNSPMSMKNVLEKAIENPAVYQEKVSLVFQTYLNHHTYDAIFKKYQKIVEERAKIERTGV